MRILALIAALALACGAPADAQRLAHAHVASMAGASPERDTVRHPTGQRMLAATGLGIVTGIVVLRSGYCFKDPCGWDFTAEAVGYFAGVVVGSALVSGQRCSLAKRLGLSLSGALGGAAVSLAVASASYMAKDGAAVIATVLAGGAPVMGSALALRRCD